VYAFSPTFLKSINQSINQLINHLIQATRPIKQQTLRGKTDIQREEDRDILHQNLHRNSTKCNN